MRVNLGKDLEYFTTILNSWRWVKTEVNNYREAKKPPKQQINFNAVFNFIQR